MSDYQMVRGPDDTIWVTLQPLANEVKQILDNSKIISTTGMSKDEIKGIDFTILSLEAVYNFLNSLITEQQIKEMVEQNKDANNN
jgi:hypothetical protein